MGIDAVTVAGWEERFEQLTDAIGPFFKRQDLRRQALGYLQGLLGRVGRKNSWQLSEYLGREGPYGIQRLWVEFRQQRVDAIARTTPASAWQRLRVGDGAKGPRVYD